MAKNTNSNANKSNTNKGRKAKPSNANAQTGSAPATNETPETFSLVDNMSNATETETATETPKAKGKGNKAQGVTKQRDNGFAVLSTQLIDPAFVELVPELMGRSAPVSEGQVIDLAESIRAQGQQQAVQVRANPAKPGYFSCVFGNTRTRAAQLLKSGYAVDEKKRVEGNPDFKLRVEVVECDDETAFTRNVAENALRVQCSPIDNAKNQARMRDEFGMSDVAIAKVYGFASSASVTRLKKLLSLPADVQTAVHGGDCTQAAANLLADFTGQKIHGADVEPADVTAVYLKAVDLAGAGEPVNADSMVKAIKALRAERAPAPEPKPEGETGTAPEGTTGEPGTAPEGETGTTGETPAAPTGDGTAHALTIRAFKDLCKEIKADEKCPGNVQNAMQLILNTLAGEVEPAGFAQWFAANLK